MQSRLYKNPNSQSFFMNQEKLGSMLSPRQQDQYFKFQILILWMNWENLCPYLSFNVENKMGNSYKRGWRYFKLNKNYGDSPFSKI